MIAKGLSYIHIYHDLIRKVASGAMYYTEYDKVIRCKGEHGGGLHYYFNLALCVA